jgi:hypothetical protein
VAATLVPTEYDNGEGQKFSLTFFSNSTTVAGSSLPSSSLMNFIAGNKSKVLRENPLDSSNPALLINITIGTDAAAINGVKNNIDSCGTPVFSFTLQGTPVKVCDAGDPTLYSLDYVQKGTAYYVNVSNTNDSSLASRNTELQQILSSIKPL